MNSVSLFTRRRKFTHERLEPRMMLTINAEGDDFLVNDVVPGTQGDEDSSMSVAVSEAAGTLVTYTGFGAGNRDSVFLRRFDTAGAAQEVMQASTSIRGFRRDSVVAANAAGNSVVVWHGRGLGDKDGIFMQRFDVSGSKVGDETLVNETTGGIQFDPAVAMAGDGSFVVTWNGPTADDPTAILARRFNADGTAAAGEVRVNTTTADHQTEPAIAMNASGSYVITWTSEGQDGDSRGIYGQRFDSAGVAQGDEFQLNTTTSRPQQESSVWMQADGTFMAVWGSFEQDGDSWSVVGRQFDASGSPTSGEIIVNTTTTGQQRRPQIAGTFGNYLVAWQSNLSDGSGWEVMAQEFDSTGARVGTEMTVNSTDSGANSGHQQRPAVAFSEAGEGAIVWSGHGSADRQGTFGRSFVDDRIRESNLTPDLAEIPNQTVEAGTELELVVTATDPNAGDSLTFQLDEDSLAAGATITRNEADPRTATIRWTPTANDAGTIVEFIVTVTDNGDPPLADAESFSVEVVDDAFRLDLNGPNQIGTDAEAEFPIGLGPASIADDALSISNAGGGVIARATVVLRDTPDGSRESLSVDTTGTNIVATYNQFLRRLFLTHASGDPESAENYERVLRTLTYDNTSDSPTGTTRIVDVQVNDPGVLSNKPSITVNVVSAENLVGLASELTAAGAQLFGASWSAATAEQRALFEDGGSSLPFNEVTNADRTLNASVADPNNITDPEIPVWLIPDPNDSNNTIRLEGVQTPAALAEQIGMSIPLSVDPTFAEVPNQTLLIGSPLHVSLDGYDPNGGPLKYTVTTDSPNLVEARILTGNRSARVQVEGYGDMVFELFEQRAERATDRFVQLASDDLFNDGQANNDFFYDDVIFHRVIDNFVIQGGDPDGTGTGGTGTDFDDQFHVDLQHNRTGLLSFAKSLEDTNDSQFFITEGASGSLRNLDFHHSVFGVLVEGEDVRAAVSDTSIIRPSAAVPRGDRRGDRPGVPQIGNETPVEFDITMSNVEIFEDTENAVLFLKANSTANVGDIVEVTVTVEDQQGNTFDQTFSVTLAADTVNGRPFLDDLEPVVTIDADTTATIQLSAQDVEGDDFVFGARLPGVVSPIDGSFTELPQPDFDFVVNPTTGLLEVTPTPGFTGTLELQVQVAAAGFTNPIDLPDSEVDRQLITIQVV